METKKTKKLTLKKEVIQELNDDQMNYAFGGCSGIPTGYSPCQQNPTRKCTISQRVETEIQNARENSVVNHQVL